MLTLPYVVDGKKKEVTFLPGKNEVRTEDWKALYAQHEERFRNHYLKLIRVFQPKTEAIVLKGDISVPVEVGVESVDFISLSIPSAIDLIENTMEPEELEEYLTIEKAQERPRKLVVKALKEKIGLIEQIDKDRKSK